MMMARLTASSWETIFHRSTLMAKGKCSAAEYQSMGMEKAAAAQLSMIALMTGKTLAGSREGRILDGWSVGLGSNGHPEFDQAIQKKRH
jgi:hypothetical protein